MDHHLVAAAEDEHDGLEQPGLVIEAEAELTLRVVVLAQGLDP